MKARNWNTDLETRCKNIVSKLVPMTMCLYLCMQLPVIEDDGGGGQRSWPRKRNTKLATKLIFQQRTVVSDNVR